VQQAAEELVGRFEKGWISRRELVAGILALAARPTAVVQAAAAQPIQVSGIDHVAFRVGDLQRSASFYKDLFGATVRSESTSSVFLDVGNDWIALFGKDAVSTAFGVTPLGVDHVSFHSVNARSAEDRMRVLREHGLEPQSPSGSGRVYFKNPDGVVLQLS
jgi:catechol 2,3-dioxygenase-like lactoylglutathione lyase family enzyme